jgi:hypothetical protein
VQDVLDHDDRGVDEEADGDRQPTQRHCVQPNTERSQKEACQRDGQRNGQRHDQGRAQVAEQQQDDEHHEHAAQHHRPADATQRRIHQLGLVVDGAQFDAFGQRPTNVLNRLADARPDLHGVGPELLDDPRADDLALQAMRDPSTYGGGLTNVGHVTKENRHVSADGDDGAPQVLDCVRSSQHPHGPFDRALRNDAARRVQIRLFDGVPDVIQADAPSGHAFRIELHLKLPQVAAETLDGRDSWHGHQPVVDLELRKVA